MASSIKQADCRDIFKKAFKRVRTSTTVVPSDHPSPTPSTYAALKTPENTDGESDDPQPTEISKRNTRD